MERNEAWALLTKYNKDHFHLQHALTVEAVMRWYANELGYGDHRDLHSFPPRRSSDLLYFFAKGGDRTV